MERVGDRLGQMERVFFDRPNPTAGYSANGRRRRIQLHKVLSNKTNINKISVRKIIIQSDSHINAFKFLTL